MFASRVLRLAAFLLVAAFGIASAGGEDFTRRFETEVAPLLVQRCVECHGPQAKKGRLDLSRKETALAGGESGKAIVPGKSDESLLWHYVESDEMPKGRTALSDAQKRLLREWINAGAPWTRER
ncbi:MAG: hypothetical protein KY475_12200, partial [Planctomycetes bacterium]|nr:hypothetical protein [Planctomycetota bacterium]